MNGAMKIIAFGLAALVAAGAYNTVRERAEQKRTLQGFVDSISAIKQRQGIQETALQARFDQIDVDQYMQASRLASSDSIVGGRAELARYRALLVERDQLAASGLTQLHALLDTLPQGELRDNVARGASRAEASNLKLQSTLGQSQVANADAVQAVFDWADRNHAIVHARGTSLVVDGQVPLSELKALEARVVETGKAVNDSLLRVRAVQSDSVKNLAKLRGDLTQ